MAIRANVIKRAKVAKVAKVVPCFPKVSDLESQAWGRVDQIVLYFSSISVMSLPSWTQYSRQALKSENSTLIRHHMKWLATPGKSALPGGALRVHHTPSPVTQLGCLHRSFPRNFPCPPWNLAWSGAAILKGGGGEWGNASWQWWQWLW